MKNREIKFRVWNGIEMNFYLWVLPDLEFDFNGVPKTPVMQYTGIKDTNDKEIYEGDLIECPYCKEEYGIVEYYDTGFRLKWSDNNCGNARLTRIDDWANVVGNIYENPELLVNTSECCDAPIVNGRCYNCKENI